MNIIDLFRQLIKKIRGEPEFPDPMVHNLIRRLENTRENECACDDVYALMDEFAEASRRGEDVEKLKPLLRHHLKMCQECEEEYQALIQVLEGTM